MELLRARWPLGGFGWGDLASAHTTDSWMLTVARVLGADGLTFLTALLGAFAWTTIRVAVAVSRDGAAEHGDAVSPGAARAVATVDAVRPMLMGTVGVAVLGTLVTIGPPPVVGSVDVLVVQANDLSSTARGAQLDLEIAEAHADATVAAVEEGGRPELTVWAENSIDRDVTSESGAALRRPLERALTSLDGPLLAGVTADGPTDETFRNTVMAFDADADVTGTYVKRQAVPFGEYVPWRPVLGGLPPLALVPRDAVEGDGPVTLEVDGVRIAPVICFETLFGPIVRTAVAHESAQHVAQSRLRAVETGRAVVHAAIAGTSALVLPDGTISQIAPLFEVATLRAELPVVTGSTPAMLVGDWVSGLLGLAALGLTLDAVVRTVGRRRGAVAAEQEQL